MNQPLNRQNIPPKPGPDTEIFRVNQGDGVNVVIASKAIWGVWCHWDGHRTRECTATFIQDAVGGGPIDGETIREQSAVSLQSDKAGKQCVGHERSWPLRWKGYLYVVKLPQQAYGFLELTPSAGNQILSLAPSGENLRGLYLRVRRQGNGNKTRLVVELTKPGFTVEGLKPDRDPEKVLRSLWNWPSVR